MSAWNEIVKVLQPQINANTESENKTSMYVCQISMYVSMSNATNEPRNEHKTITLYNDYNNHKDNRVQVQIQVQGIEYSQ